MEGLAGNASEEFGAGGHRLAVPFAVHESRVEVLPGSAMSFGPVLKFGFRVGGEFDGLGFCHAGKVTWRENMSTYFCDDTLDSPHALR